MAKIPEPINDTTYEVGLLGKDKIEIGDKESADFKPHIKLNRWDGECFIKVGLPTTEKPEPIIEGGKVKFKDKDIEAHFYALDPKTITAEGKEGRGVSFIQNELGGFEFEIILKKKPPTNKIVLDIETHGLRFLYQPALTQEEIDAGDTQPDNAIGSYAVYHDTRTNIHRSQADAEKYKCGKAFHIYRPKITDAEGKWVWGDLHIDVQAGTLTTTIPQDFLDTAVYPVSTGTTNFGYETIGSLTSGLDNHLCASQFPSGGAGLGVSITGHIVDVGVGVRAKCALYDASRNLVANSTTEEKVNYGNGWITFNFETAPTINNADYIIAGWGLGAGPKLNRDADESVDRWWKAYVYNGFPAIPASDRTGKFSIYCTYGPAVEAPTVTTQAVDDITATTATGNGTITDTGGENCSKRGVCWNKTGSPTVADDKSEETDSFGAEAFDVSMAGLDPGTLYYVRAYAYNSEGYGYGSEVQFTTTQVISPSAIAAPSAVQPPTLSGSGSAPVTASPVATPSAVQAPALSGSGAAPITLSPVASISAVQTPTIATTVQFIEPSPIAVSSAVQAPSLSGSGVASVSPSAVSVGSSVQFPALSGSGSAPVTASPVATVSSIQAPVLEPTGAAPVSPSPMQASSAVQAPSMSGSGVATISSSPIAAASAIQTPSIATGVQSIAPLPVAVTSIIVAPIISVAISYRYRYNVFTGNLDIVRAAMQYRYRYNVFTGNMDILGRL